MSNGRSQGTQAAQGPKHEAGKGEATTAPKSDLVDQAVEETILRGEDLPLITWETGAAETGATLTSVGFAKIAEGFEFKGYILGEETVDSAFDSPDGGKKKQIMYSAFGTARCPLQGAGGATADVKGYIKIPKHAALIESIDRARDMERVRGQKIALHLSFAGRQPDKMEGGVKARSGRALWRVTEIVVTTPTAKPAN